VTDHRYILLEPGPSPRVIPWHMTFECNTGVALVDSSLAFRPTRVRTHGVKKPGEARIISIDFGHKKQIEQPIDMWWLTFDYLREVHEEALRSYGLLGKTDLEIDAFLDKHNLELPDPGRLHLGTLHVATRARIETTPGPYTVRLFGVAAET